jgi:hypothetical protein
MTVNPLNDAKSLPQTSFTSDIQNGNSSGAAQLVISSQK